MAEPRATRATPPTRTRARKAPAKDGWQELFLDALKRLGAVSYACQVAGVHRSTVYRHRDDDEVFAAAWEEAETDAIDALALEARKRAMHHSDRLLMFLLQAHRPEMYSERHRLEHSGKVEGGGITLTQLARLASWDNTPPNDENEAE